MGLDADTKSDDKIRILIVDDHRIFREGIQVNLAFHDDITVLGHGANGEQALKLSREMRPDVVIMDINLPLMNGIQVTRTLVAEGLPTRVIIVTAYDDAEQVIHAMRAGASAYCAKEIEPDKLVEVIRYVHRGHYVVNDQVFDQEGLERWLEKGVEAVAGQYYVDMAEPFSPLSPREMEILQHVTRGLSNKEIAQALQISHQTVKNHMTSILRKLAVEDRTQAAVFALRRGWVRLRDTGTKFESGDSEAG
jgi:DNA-binding NarL/FixJ family response regulator